MARLKTSTGPSLSPSPIRLIESTPTAGSSGGGGKIVRGRERLFGASGAAAALSTPGEDGTAFSLLCGSGGGRASGINDPAGEFSLVRLQMIGGSEFNVYGAPSLSLSRRLRWPRK